MLQTCLTDLDWATCVIYSWQFLPSTKIRAPTTLNWKTLAVRQSCLEWIAFVVFVVLQPNLRTPTTSCQLLEAALDKHNCLLIRTYYQRHSTSCLTLRLRRTRWPWSSASCKGMPRNHKYIWMQEMTGWQCPAGPHWHFTPVAQQRCPHKRRALLPFRQFPWEQQNSHVTPYSFQKTIITEDIQRARGNLHELMDKHRQGRET